MALYVVRGVDGFFHCPEGVCARKYVTAASLRRHCKTHGIEATTVRPTTDDDKKKTKREQMRSTRAKQAARRETDAQPQRSLYTSFEADTQGIHMAAHPLVEYRQSRIDGAGYGLFACEVLLSGDVVTQYEGCIVDDQPKDPTYAIQIETRSGVKYLDGLRLPVDGKGLGSFVNKESRKHPRARTNCSMVQEGKCMYIEVDTTIQAGEELCTTYGKGYRLQRK